MNLLLVSPLLLPLTAAAVSLLFAGRAQAQRVLSLVYTWVMLALDGCLQAAVASRGIQATWIGGWPAPFGITLVADMFSSIMLVLAGLTGFAVCLYSTAGLGRQRERFGYYPLLNVMLLGVNGAFLTGDMFNLYVWFEVLLIASFVLLALGAGRAQMEGALKYFTLNLMSSALFLTAAGLLYGFVGTLNIADLAVRLRGMPGPFVTALAMLFLTAFGIKAAVFPLFFWLPASYHTAPIAVSAVFAGLLTKVGVYALLRAFTMLFAADPAFTHTVILVLAGLTMLCGVLGAMAQQDFRRVLSFHIISQIGYMIMGLGLFTPPAVAGAVFYIAHHIVVKTNLFLIAGLAERYSGAFELKKMGGLYAARPALAALFLVPALSLAGVPPLSGFFAKLFLVQAGLEAQQHLIVAVSLLVSLLTLYSMTKLWMEAFWKPAAGPAPAPPAGPAYALWLPALLLAAVTLAIAVAPGPLFRLSEIAAAQMLDPSAYIAAVLETKR